MLHLPQPRKRKVIPGLEVDDEADSHPPPPKCKIIRLTPPQATPVPEAVPPQAPPQVPMPPRAPSPPEAEPSLNDNFAPPPPQEPQVSPRAEAQPAASKDYSSAKSDDSDASSDDDDDEDDDVDSADREAPEDEDELAIINPSQELAIVATREASAPHVSPAHQTQARRHRPI